MIKMFRNFLIVCAVLLVGLFVLSKGESDIVFPIDSSGAPDMTIVKINGKNYKHSEEILTWTSEVVKGVVEVEADDKLTIVIPQGNLSKWVVGEKDGMTIKEVQTNLGTSGSRVDGVTCQFGVGSSMQIFGIEIEDSVDKIVMKWVNCNELEKEFEDMQEYYNLTIKIR